MNKPIGRWIAKEERCRLISDDFWNEAFANFSDADTKKDSSLDFLFSIGHILVLCCCRIVPKPASQVWKATDSRLVNVQELV